MGTFMATLAALRLSGMDRLLKKCCIRSSLVKKCLAECLGVFIIIVFGCGSVAQVVTSKDKAGQYLSINLGFALGTTFGIHVSRGVSGAHLNPAVTLSLCFLGRHPWFDLPFYALSQLLGAFLAAATVALQYYGTESIKTCSLPHYWYCCGQFRLVPCVCV
uniref:Aquaporin-3 n=1 Tax=Osmerus mordax TaxID=8014 RepID=C1BIR2_OSMMO|nr:Aquaporin-3 [Osmerus mordax]